MQPAFLCLGFQKCGTTTLFDLLSQHRDIALPRDVKEPMYYRVPGARALGGQRYYHWRYYAHLSPNDGRLVGEINAGLTFQGCAKWIKKDFSPGTRLIFLIRNPVERAWSSYKFFTSLGFLPLNVIQDDTRNGHAAAFDRYVRSVLCDSAQHRAIMKHRLKYLVFSQGNYDYCIREYEDHFPHIRLILFEDFIRNQKKICEQLFDFLGVAPDENIQYGLRSNETHRAAASPLRARVREIVKGGDYFLDELIGMRHWAPPVYQAYHRFNRAMYRVCTVEDSDHSKMLPQTRQLLEDYYRLEKERIEMRLKRNLSTVWF